VNCGVWGTPKGLWKLSFDANSLSQLNYRQVSPLPVPRSLYHHTKYMHVESINLRTGYLGMSLRECGLDCEILTFYKF
jgi:hypothetical protein